MISPTGKGIRLDPQGDGNYGTSRGDRIHNGIDYLCDQGQDIKAPFDMKIIRESKPKAGSPMTGIAWEKGRSTGRMWYFAPFKHVIGQEVSGGEVIGIAQSVSQDYGLENMEDHIHFMVKK
jgi:hypothetical protein